jgi:hypothetical protein
MHRLSVLGAIICTVAAFASQAAANACVRKVTAVIHATRSSVMATMATYLIWGCQHTQAVRVLHQQSAVAVANHRRNINGTLTCG